MKLCLGYLVLAAMAFAPVNFAHAADPIAVPLSGTSDGLPLYDSGSIEDWSGFYAGVYGVGQSSLVDGGQVGLGAMAGVTAQFEIVLVGAEIAVHGLVDSGSGADLYGQVLGHAGLLVTDDVAIYAAAGYGLNLAPTGEQDFLLGGGIELAVAEDVSLRAQYLHSFPVSGGNPKDQITVGASFHF